MSVHNGQEYVRSAIDSVLLQAGVVFELIIINDASTDGTLGILESYQDERIKVVSTAENVGLVAALNLAASHARGQLFARIDADDLHHPGKLYLQSEDFKVDPDLVLLGTAFEYIDPAGRTIGRPVVCPSAPELHDALSIGNQLCHSSVMMRRSAFDQVGGYRALAGRSAQDYDLWLRLAEVGRVDCLPDLLVGYRIHPEMISITKLPQQRRAAEIYRVLADQRRAGQPENLEQAGRVVDSSPVLRDRLAEDYLRWADLFHAMGQPAHRRRMLGMAFRTSPFGRAIRRRIFDSVRWRAHAWAQQLKGPVR